MTRDKRCMKIHENLTHEFRDFVTTLALLYFGTLFVVTLIFIHLVVLTVFFYNIRSIYEYILLSRQIQMNTVMLCIIVEVKSWNCFQ